MARGLSGAAKKVNKFELYEEAVQSADVDARVIKRIFKKVRGRAARSLREDFCGSGWLCAEWCALSKKNYAVGLDLDRDVLQWGRDRHLSKKLGDRVRLLHCNVLDAPDERFDIVVAFNYSYQIFHTRSELLEYVRAVRGHLVDDGVLILDIYGGPDSQTELEEEREHDNFTYVWDQASFNPVDYRFLAHIHFSFPDGSEMREAFTYDWRLWQLPELRDVLLEAGYSDVLAFFEKEDADGEGTGKYRQRERVDADLAWNAYLVATK